MNSPLWHQICSNTPKQNTVNIQNTSPANSGHLLIAIQLLPVLELQIQVNKGEVIQTLSPKCEKNQVNHMDGEGG